MSQPKEEERAMVTYTMRTSASTFGAVTGKRYTWKPDEAISAPDGEFKHLGDGYYDIRPMEAKAKGGPPGGKQKKTGKSIEGAEVEHKGGGFYEVRRLGQEAVQVRGKEKVADMLGVDDIEPYLVN